MVDNVAYFGTFDNEVLALDQDALGHEATCVATNGDIRIYAKPLEDGGHAVGFFNLGALPAAMDFNQFEAAGLAGKLHVRDLWRQQNLDDINANGGTLSLTIPAHGVMLCKFSAAK